MDSKKRGPYQKGIDKKREIMSVAMVYFSKNGFYATSMREIAKACNLTQAGLLHHFGSKEELLMRIVEERDLAGRERYTEYSGTWAQRVLNNVRNEMNFRTEALLFSTLAAEAEDPAHPAHQFMIDRYVGIIKLVADSIARDKGNEQAAEEDVLLARIVVAIWDGLQIQWLMVEDFDMMPAFEEALARLQGSKPAK